MKDTIEIMRDRYRELQAKEQFLEKCLRDDIFSKKELLALKRITDTEGRVCWCGDQSNSHFHAEKTGEWIQSGL